MMFNLFKFLEINSRTARQLTKESIKRINQNQFLDCMYEIKNATNSGQFNVYFKSDIHPEVQDRLRNLGYKVEYTGRFQHCSAFWGDC